MNRRGFISATLKGSAVVATAPMAALASSKIWVPQKQLVEVPEREIEIAQSLVVNGQVIYGYLIAPDFHNSINLEHLSQDALHYFSSNSPVLILSNISGIELNGSVKTFARFRFVGSKEQVIKTTKANIVGAFENTMAFGWIAANG